MINRFLIFVVTIFALALPSAVFAQDCRVHAEAIVKLRSPSFGSYNVWDTIHGEIPTHERFKSAIILEGGNVLVVGERIHPDKKDKKSIIFTEIGRNGRILWETQSELAALGDIVTMLPHEKGALVLANIAPEKKRTHIWIGIFDIQGKLLSQNTIKGGNADLVAHDIVKASKGSSFIVAAFSKIPGVEQPGWSTLYRVNSKGAVFDDQAFVIGAENAIKDLHVLDNGEYMATGYIYDAGGRRTGWIMKLADNLRMVWQQAYPRGAGAELAAGHSMIAGMFAVTGTALPGRNGNRAAWVMIVGQAGGNVGWQRYFSGDLHFEGRDILTAPDGMISVLADGKAPERSDIVEHVRLFTINPRGVLFASDEFFNGEGVDAFELIPGAHHERLIIGETRLVYQMEEQQGPQPQGEEDSVVVKRSREGWVVAAPGADIYDDPCKIKPRSLP